MTEFDPNKLRTGWTTGACATAAAKAAAIGLFSGIVPDQISITLPKGQTPQFDIEYDDRGAGWVSAAVRKDAGDDPDVTDKAVIEARVALAEPGSGVHFQGGPGVGTVTKAGLPIPPGEPAINPVPRQMIREALTGVAEEQGAKADFTVTISVPGGTDLAAKTWNPRLGIVGGISILGTTGIVRPFSCAAWIASIHRGIDVARAADLPWVLGATGATSEATAQKLLNLPDIACLDMGDFAGGLLKYLRTHPIPRLTIAGGVGKMTKLAQGAIDLHSARSQVDFDRLAASAVQIGADGDRISSANTAAEVFSITGSGLAEIIAKDALATVKDVLRGAPVVPEIMVIDRNGTLLARHGEAL